MTPEEKRLRPARMLAEQEAGTRLTRLAAQLDGRPYDGTHRDRPEVLVQMIQTELWMSRDDGATTAADIDRAAGSHITDESIADALTLVDRIRRMADSYEVSLISAARRRKMTWRNIASLLDLDSPQAAQQRWERLTDARMSASPELRRGANAYYDAHEPEEVDGQDDGQDDSQEGQHAMGEGLMPEVRGRR